MNLERWFGPIAPRRTLRGGTSTKEGLAIEVSRAEQPSELELVATGNPLIKINAPLSGDIFQLLC